MSKDKAKAAEQDVKVTLEEEVAVEEAQAETEATETETVETDEVDLAKEIDKLRQELQNSKAKAEENWNNFLLAKAETENAKRRASIDVQNAHKFGLEKFSDALLPVLDSLEKAIEHAYTIESPEAKATQEGIELTCKMFIDTLEKFGVKQLDPKGEVFNPEHHEAMTMIEHPEMDDNAIVDVIQKGYLLNDRVVRPARVVVCKKKK